MKETSLPRLRRTDDGETSTRRTRSAKSGSVVVTQRCTVYVM